MSPDQSKGTTKTAFKCSSCTLPGIFCCLLVGSLSPLVLEIHLNQSSPHFQLPPTKSGQSEINIDLNTHTQTKRTSLLHRLWVSFRRCDIVLPCKRTRVNKRHALSFSPRRSIISSPHFKILMSGSTAAPDHDQTAHLRGTVGRGGVCHPGW